MAQKTGQPAGGGGARGSTTPHFFTGPAMGDSDGLRQRQGTGSAGEVGSPEAQQDTTSAWLAYTNEETGQVYYYNTHTEETTWEEPAEGFTWSETFPGRSPNFDPEHLNDDYLETDWVPPSLKTAEETARNKICLLGKAPLCTPVAELSTLGEGVTVYLHLVSHLAITFGIMGILYLPLLVSNVQGRRIPGSLADQFAVFSIANVGDDSFSSCTSSTPDRVACRTSLRAAGSGFSHSFFWPEGKSVSEVGTIYAWIDVAAMVVFVIMIGRFALLLRRYAQDFRALMTTASDYAIQIWGLPPDALQGEIVDHFDGLYNLQHRDHADRDPIKPMKYPVGHFGNTCDDLYYCKWVAECIVAHPTGAAIRKYQQHANLSRKLRRARAHAKKYSTEGTIDEKLYTKWDRKIQLLEWRIVETLRSSQFLTGRNPHETVCSFLIFNNEESWHRCIQDYEGSEFFWNRILQRKHLRFLEEYPLVVTPAPEPSDIMWENLEASRQERSKRRCITACGIAALLLVSFSIVLTVLYFAALFSSNLAPAELCDSGIPLTQFGAYSSRWSSSGSLPTFPASSQGEDLYTRPATSTERTLRDAQCAVVGKDHWLTLANSTSSQNSTIEYNVSACSPDLQCYDVTSAVVCPCVNSRDESNGCTTVSCDVVPTGTPGCSYAYDGDAVRDCYCYQVLSKLVLQEGPYSAAISLFTGDDMICHDFAFLFFIGRFLSGGVAILTAIMNLILEQLIKLMVPFEHPHSLTDLAGAISTKLSLAMAINTVFVPIAAKVRLFDSQPNATGTQNLAYPFGGDDKYVGFPVHWYTTVGYTLASTMVLDIFVPHMIPLLSACILKPLSRRRARRAGGTVVTQRDLNEKFEGPEFDMSTRLAYILNTVACTIMFCSGIPLLVPMAAINLTGAYWIDKTLILRFYKKAPQTDSGTILAAIKMLPFVVAIHFALTFFTLGDSTVFVSDELLSVVSYVPSGYTFLGHDTMVLLAESMSRQHMLPCLVVFVVVVVCILLYFFPLSPLARVITHVRLLCGYRSQRTAENNPPYTYFFMKEVIPKSKSFQSLSFAGCFSCRCSCKRTKAEDAKSKLTLAEALQGWVIREEKITGKRFKIKQWRNDGVDSQGIAHKKGELKRTWECIRDDAVHSYNIDQNPKYADAMNTLYSSRRRRRR